MSSMEPQQNPSYQSPPQGPAGQIVAPKNPAISLLISFFIPGLGSILNGNTPTGVGILIGYGISWLLAFVLIGLPFLIGFWIWGMYDGYTSAQKWNAQHGIIS